MRVTKSVLTSESAGTAQERAADLSDLTEILLLIVEYLCGSSEARLGVCVLGPPDLFLTFLLTSAATICGIEWRFRDRNWR